MSVGFKSEDVLQDVSTDVQVSKWARVTNEGMRTPQQTNGYDCGVFTAMACSYAGADKAFDYCQEDMLFLRKWMVLECACMQVHHEPFL